MSFRIKGLSPEPFRHLFGQPDEVLAKLGVERQTATECPGYPDRIELREADPGETLLLLNFTHQPADTAYRSSHAIYVAERARRAFDAVDTVPETFQTRTMSLRAFDADDQMLDAELVDGADSAHAIERLFANGRVAYIHAHYAMRGCYAARVERA